MAPIGSGFLFTALADGLVGKTIEIYDDLFRLKARGVVRRMVTDLLTGKHQIHLETSECTGVYLKTQLPLDRFAVLD